MKRKDLYVEIYNTVLTEVHIADRDTLTAVSYTHLTLPTNREV